LVKAGDAVGPGAPVIQIHSTRLQLNLDNRRQELNVLRGEVTEEERQDDKALAQSLAALQERRSLVAARLQLTDSEYTQRERLLTDRTASVLVGASPQTDLLELQALQQATRAARLGIVDIRSQLDLDVSDRRNAHQQRQRLRQAQLAAAEARLRDAESALRVTTVEAPDAGWIESLLVAPGSLVQPGTELARLVPRAAPRRVVALVPLDEARHAVPGGSALVELTPPHTRRSVPLSARIEHVSREVAPQRQVVALLGGASHESFVQLELLIVNTPEYLRLQPTLRSGSKAIVSLETPKRTLASLAVEAIETWLPAPSGESER
jgi:multidrug resistance efflux pump